MEIQFSTTKLKKTCNQYQPNSVTAPGDTLLEILEERGMTESELAERLGLTQKTVNGIIEGKAPISDQTALALERVLGIPAGFWNRYEAAYRKNQAGLQGDIGLENQARKPGAVHLAVNRHAHRNG